MAGGLRPPVDDEVDPAIVQDLPDAGDVLHRPEHVAPVGRDHQPGIGREGRFNSVGGGNSAVLEGKDGQPDPVLPLELVKRPQDRVVVEFRRDDVAPSPFSVKKPPLDEDVQGIGRVLGEDHVLRRLSAKEGRERLAGERSIILTLAAGGPSRPEDGGGQGIA